MTLILLGVSIPGASAVEMIRFIADDAQIFPQCRRSRHTDGQKVMLLISNEKEKFFPRTAKDRLFDPSEIRAFEFNREFGRFEISSVSATIGNGWSTSDVL